MLELKVEKRETNMPTTVVKPRNLRKVGKLPAVFYGKKEKAVSISVLFRDFEKVYKDAGESTVIKLVGVGEPKEALIHDIDFDPVKDIPRHIDFFVLEKGAKVDVNIPLEFIGESSAVKNLGGNLVKVLHSIEIKVSPKDLPKHLSVDISGLVDFESKILAKGIKLPESAELITKPEEVVALVAEAVEEIEETVEAPDLNSIEVEKKGKEEVKEEENGTEEKLKN